MSSHNDNNEDRIYHNETSAARRVATTGIFAALALIFSYIEAIFPFQSGIPGVKLGLANLVIVLALYEMGAGYALAINLIRVIIAGLLFSGLYGMLYSMAGSLVSFLVMYLLYRTGWFSVIGVSMGGGVAHNFGQLLVAAIIVSTGKLFLYFPVLIFSGIAAGIIVGIGALVLIRHLPHTLFRQNTAAGPHS